MGLIGGFVTLIFSLPIKILFNFTAMFFTIFFVLLKNIKKLTVRKIISLLIFSFINSFVMLFFIQIPLSFSILLIFKKTPIELLGGFPIGFILYSLISLLLYLGVMSFSLKVLQFSFVDRDFLKELEKESIRKSIRNLILVSIAILLVYLFI